MSRRVLVWADHTSPYGVGRFTRTLVEGLRPLGWQVEDASEHSVDLWGESPLRAFTDRDTPRRVIADGAPDVAVFVQASPISNVAAIQEAHAEGLPHVVVVQGGGWRALPAIDNLMDTAAAGMRAADAIVTPSRALLAALRGHVTGPGVGVVIPNGVPDVFFEPTTPADRGAARAALGVPDDAVVCLSAARMEHEKGWDLLLDAVARLGSFREHMWFLWAGDGSQLRRLSAMVRLRGLADRVRILGLVLDMPPLVALSDAFVLPTRHDDAPFALIEAMAGGLAVVATDVGDIARIVGDAGIVLPHPASGPRDATVDDLRDALGRVSHDHDRRALGERARRRADPEHRASVMFGRYDELLRSLV